MNRTDSQIRLTGVAPLPSVAEAPAIHPARLFVVIANVEAEAVLAGKILSLSKERRLDVLLLGIAESFSQETELRRKLIVLAAFIRDGGTRVEIQVDYGRNWVEGLRMMTGPSDLVACSVDDAAVESPTPLSDTLSRQLGLPVYVFAAPPRPQAARGIVGARLAAWIGSVAIIVGFIWLQVPAARAANDSASTTMLLLSLPVEIGLIWLWNSLFG